MNAPVKLGRRIVSAVAALTVVAVLAAAGWEGYRMALAQPFKRVVFAGELERLRQVDLEALSRAVQAAESPSLESVREAARRVPWVRDASVRREFPDGVEITFEAYRAFAHWNDRDLVSPEGEVFAAEDAAELPRLRGPEGSAVAVAREFPLIAEALAPVGSPVKELRLSARGAWEVVLASGLTIELGRGDWKARAQRFAGTWPGLAEDERAARYADLRYPNGFALRAALTPTHLPSPRPSPRGEGEQGRGGKTK